MNHHEHLPIHLPLFSHNHVESVGSLTKINIQWTSQKKHHNVYFNIKIKSHNSVKAKIDKSENQTESSSA